MTDVAAILKCVNHCRSRKDWRGRWRAENTCEQRLRVNGASPAIAAAMAAGAARVGAWLAAR